MDDLVLDPRSVIRQIVNQRWEAVKGLPRVLDFAGRQFMDETFGKTEGLRKTDINFWIDQQKAAPQDHQKVGGEYRQDGRGHPVNRAMTPENK